MEAASGILLVGLYAGLAVSTFRSIPLVLPSVRPARRFLAIVASTWAGWFLYQTLSGPPLLAWEINLTRALHIPLIVAIGFNVWAGRRRVE